MNTLSDSSRWEDLFGAVEFVERRVKQWGKDGMLRVRQEEAFLDRVHGRLHGWRAQQGAGLPMSAGTGLPPAEEGESPAARSLRYWIFLAVILRKMEQAGILSLRQSHQLTRDVGECASYLRRRLSDQELTRIEESERRLLGEAIESTARQAFPDQLLHSENVDDRGGTTEGGRPSDSPRAAAPPKIRRTVLEMLIDPQNLQWLMAVGGALMAVGLVILLWVNELFTPPTLALVMGLVNIGLLCLGWWVLRSTSKQLAGRGLTLLACLIMPLNLWYYHAHGILTVTSGLWAAGLVIAVLYLGSALILRDEMFVYVFSAGVTMTGLLFLASLPASAQEYWKVALPATLLVVLGLAGIHLERVFSEGEGPFTRRRFGLAFFWSGQAQMGLGLLIVLFAQIAGDWLRELFFARAPVGPWGDAVPWRWLALALLAAGTYAYVYSDLLVRKVGVYSYAAALTLICSLTVALRLFGLTLGLDIWIIVFAAVALAVNFAWVNISAEIPAARPLPWLGMFLLVVAVFLGLITYVRALSPDMRSVWAGHPPGLSYVAALALAALSARGSAYLLRHNPMLTGIYFFVTGAATLLGATAILAALGLEKWSEHALLLMLLPIAYLLVAHFYRGHSPAQPLLWVSHAAAVVMLVSSFASAFDGFIQVARDRLNLVLAGFFAEALVFYCIALVLHRQSGAVFGAAAMLAAAVWQLLTFAGVVLEVYVLTFALVGLAMLVGYRLDFGGKLERGPWADGLFQSANSFLSIALIVAACLGLSRLPSQHTTWALAGLYALLTVISLLALVLVSQQSWRRWYLIASIGEGFFCFAALVALTHLSGWQKVELFCVLAGLVLLVVGHLGWYREQERENDLVTLQLLFGSILLGAPLAIAALVDRWSNHFLVMNELGFFVSALLLLVTGVLFRLRATTITGAILSTLYFLTLLIFVPWSRLNTIALFITIGGGAIFLLGLTLSLFRDRLVAVVGKIQRREGVFQVLTWR